MIPVVTLNNKGEVVGQQAFNDNLTHVEQINRKLLAAIFCTQQKLTNDRDECERMIMAGKYDEAKLTAVDTAATALVKALDAAIVAFEEAIAL